MLVLEIPFKKICERAAHSAGTTSPGAQRYRCFLSDFNAPSQNAKLCNYLQGQYLQGQTSVDKVDMDAYCSEAIQQVAPHGGKAQVEISASSSFDAD